MHGKQTKKTFNNLFYIGYVLKQYFWIIRLPYIKISFTCLYFICLLKINMLHIILILGNLAGRECTGCEHQ